MPIPAQGSIILKSGESQLYVSVPYADHITYKVVPEQDQLLALTPYIQVEPNAAQSQLGCSISASVDSEFRIDEQGILLDGELQNEHAFDWLVLDFHTERTIRALHFQYELPNASSVEYLMQIWGGKIFFSTSPVVGGTLTNANPREVIIRFAEQKTQKVLLQFGTLNTTTRIFNNNKSVIIKKIKLETSSLPFTLSAQIDEQPPFFQQSGELTPGMVYPLGDIGEAINAYIQKEDVEIENNTILVPMKLHSHAEGIISFLLEGTNDPSQILFQDKMAVTGLGHFLEGIITEFYLQEESQEFLKETDLVFHDQASQTIYLPSFPQDSVIEAQFKLTGGLSSEILLIENRATSNRLGALGSEDFYLAQQFHLEESATITTLSLQFTLLTDEAELVLAIYKDFSQLPSDVPLDNSQISLKLTKEQMKENREPEFVRFAYDSPLILESGKYWMVLSVSQGQVTWRMEDTEQTGDTFFYTRLGGPIHWIERKDPITQKSLSAVFKVFAQPKDSGNLITLSFGESLSGTIPDIGQGTEIDTTVTTIYHNETESKLSECINAVSSGELSLTFSSSAQGILHLADLLIRFISNH